MSSASNIKLQISEQMWAPCVEDIIEMCFLSENDSMVVELLGILGNLTDANMPQGKTWLDMLSKHPLLKFIKRKIISTSNGRLDILLEAIAMVRQFCSDEISAKLLADEGLCDILIDLCRKDMSDNEVALILLQTFTQMLRFQATRVKVMSLNLIEDAVKLLGSEVLGLRLTANLFFSFVQECDRDEWGNYSSLGTAVIYGRFKEIYRTEDDHKKLNFEGRDSMASNFSRFLKPSHLRE
mmetsp:Transcript_3805/g.7095  ORF Transcript_3805/g.7095 Transcript_3805/m.7095 type:complete len:239 (+) Transcript_3805:394-1110(+)